MLEARETQIEVVRGEVEKQLGAIFKAQPKEKKLKPETANDVIDRAYDRAEFISELLTKNPLGDYLSMTKKQVHFSPLWKRVLSCVTAPCGLLVANFDGNGYLAYVSERDITESTSVPIAYHLGRDCIAYLWDDNIDRSSVRRLVGLSERAIVGQFLKSI